MGNNTASSNSFAAQTRALTRPFWAANIMEMIERLAYYGVRTVIPIYIAQADEINGLHFTHGDKGLIFLWWALVQSVLPVFTGGFADRYGYKKQIFIAIVLKVLGYSAMATQREFWPFFMGCILLAAGTAVFKPPIQGTFVKTIDGTNSGVGWGYFYMVVNIGGFLGPPAAHFLYGYSWPAVFYGCAVIVSLNLFLLFTYREVESDADKSTGPWHVIALTAREIANPRLIAFILISSVFWASYMQIFDMLPNFIVDWIDSASIAAHLPGFMLARNHPLAPQIAQEWVINFNPLLIIFLVAPLSWYVNRRMKRLTSITIGILIGAFGILTVGVSMSVLTCLAGIACFSVGEMLCSPKMNEYLGVIAPRDKKALYMGYANIPFAIGWGYGSFAGGTMYGESGEKAALAIRYLSDMLHISALPERNSAFTLLMEKTGLSFHDATVLLWNTYHPWKVWIPFGAAAVFAALLMLGFGYYVRKYRWTDADA
ncbi:MAG TPA: MFS transporter [Spirochaetota bacterium]|nr:MFS transporter [Spirochaetota bacterium]